MFPKPSAAVLSVFRFMLALIVAVYHLNKDTSRASGLVAVECFFCISGFLITMISTGVYSGRPRDYLINRFLRIYPAYWVCTVIALLIVIFFPAAHEFNSPLMVPTTLKQAMTNIVIIFPTLSFRRHILQPTWSLGTELWFYLLIGLFTAARPRLTLWLTAISLVIAPLAGLGMLPFRFYGTPIGNADAFLLGSCAWQFRDHVRLRRPILLACGLTLALTFLALGPYVYNRGVNELVTAPVMAVLLVALYQAKFAISAGVQAAFDYLGKLSYPIFLLHIPVGALLYAAFGLGAGWTLAFYGLAATLPLAALIHMAVEVPIDHLRKRVRVRNLRPSGH